MRPLIELCLRQRRVVIGLCLVLSIVAGILTRNAPFDAFPEFAPPRVEIQTEAAGLSSEEVETLVTMPLEAVLAGTSGLKEMRSRSVLGLSSVVLILQRDTDVVRTRALISERLARATLPAVAGRPILLSPRSSTSRVLKIAVSSRELSQMELTDLIRWVVRPRLISVPGVANVALWGAKTRQLQVQVDPTRLQAHELTLDRVIAATQGAVSPAAGGFIDGANQRLPILHRSFIETPEDLAQVPVDPSRARALTLGDVANITSGQAPPIGEAVVTSGPGLLLVIEKEPGGNTLEITQSIDQELEDLLPGLPNVDIDATVFRPAGFIRRALLNLAEAMAIGTVLVVLILLLFLWDWRTALISIVAIPLSLLTASAVLALLGQTLDTMVVAGLIIALGEVVDDSIIDVENIHRRLREATRKGSTTDSLKIVLQASLEVRSAVVYATMIVILVFLPVLFIPGVAGEFFRPLAIGYSLSVLASMLVALTLTPALALVLLPGRLAQQKQASVTEKLQNFYRRILKRILRHPLRVVTLGLLLLSASVGTLATLDEVFLPHFSENDFLMHWIGKPGSSLSAMARTSNRVRKELLAIPGVRNFGAHIGRAEAADEVVGPNFAELWISVDPEAEQPATLQAVHDVVAGYPGIYNDVQTYLQERMREVLTGGSGALVVRLLGPNLRALETQGRELTQRLEEIDGVEHATPAPQLRVPQIEIVPLLDRCAALGVSPGLLRQRATTLLQGKRVGTIIRGQQPVDVVVLGTPELRSDLSALRDLLINIDTTRSVRLGKVASVRVTPMPNTISHVDGSRKFDIEIELSKGFDLGEISRQVQELVQTFPLLPGYHTTALGEQHARSEAQATLLGVSTLSLFGIFLILLADFRSPRMALLVLCSLPLALIGGVLITALTGGVVSLGTLVGLITVQGIAARNGILLLSHYRHLEEEEGMKFGPELLLRGATERLTPILMTALSTGLALVPLVVGTDTAGHEIERPMAIAILGGLTSSTLLNLIAMPVVVMLSRQWFPSAPVQPQRRILPINS